MADNNPAYDEQWYKDRENQWHEPVVGMIQIMKDHRDQFNQTGFANASLCPEHINSTI